MEAWRHSTWKHSRVASPPSNVPLKNDSGDAAASEQTKKELLQTSARSVPLHRRRRAEHVRKTPSFLTCWSHHFSSFLIEITLAGSDTSHRYCAANYCTANYCASAYCAVTSSRVRASKNNSLVADIEDEVCTQTRQERHVVSRTQ